MRLIHERAQRDGPEPKSATGEEVAASDEVEVFGIHSTAGASSKFQSSAHWTFGFGASLEVGVLILL